MTEYWRLSGAGNDFIALVAPPKSPTPAEIRSWCRRGVSIGADGLFVLRRARDGVAVQTSYPDGGAAELCLNGARCAVQLAWRVGWSDGPVTVHTAAGELRGRQIDERTVEISAPAATTPSGPLEVEIDEWPEEAVRGWLVTVGVPHLVVPWAGALGECPVATLGPPLRSHPVTGAAGANVHFVARRSRRELELRSFERGVEAETLACGTGVLAAAAVGLATGDAELPLTARTAGGFDLVVDGDAAAGGIHTLTGDARVVSRGVVEAGATPG